MDEERKGMDNFPRMDYYKKEPELYPALFLIIYPLDLFACHFFFIKTMYLF